MIVVKVKWNNIRYEYSKYLKMLSIIIITISKMLKQWLANHEVNDLTRLFWRLDEWLVLKCLVQYQAHSSELCGVH